MNLCVCLTENTLKECILAVKKINCSLIEHRIDYMQKPYGFGKLYSSKKEFIATNRSINCGGNFKGSEEERIKVLLDAIDSGAKYVDIELETEERFITQIIQKARAKKCKVIISMHDFKKTPQKQELLEVLKKEMSIGADIGKIVCYANSGEDGLLMLELIKKAKEYNFPLVSFAMGDAGKFSRILSLIYGSPFTFVSFNKPSAPGQISLKEAKELLKKINNKTKVLGVIGNPISHSKSPLIHNAGLAKLKLNCIYVPIQINDSAKAISSMKELDITGFSVTIPHKLSVMKLVDEVESNAKKIGAINTVLNKKGKLFGYNTDSIGAINALKEVTSLKGKKVYLLGNGGAARAITAGLIGQGSVVTVFARDPKKAAEFSELFGCGVKNSSEIDSSCDILVNTTPVGMYPNINDMPLDKNILQQEMVVFDIVYNPIETMLIKEARKRKCKIILGTEMFLEQAYAQFKIFTGKEAPKKIMREVLLKQLENEQKVK